MQPCHSRFARATGSFGDFILISVAPAAAETEDAGGAEGGQVQRRCGEVEGSPEGG